MSLMQTVSPSLLAELQAARVESDRLFDILKTEAIYERPIAQRHRVIFYIGHLDGFDSIQICREALGLTSEDDQLDRLFQAGIDPDASQLPSDTPADWPSLKQVREYVSRCRERVDTHLDRVPEETVLMVLEHRQMHIETLAYMFHNFDYSRKNVSDAAPLQVNSRENSANGWCPIPAGDAILGKPRDGGFGWDNEFEELRKPVPAFQIQRYSVSNGEYLRFVEDGAPLPNFWLKRGDKIFYRGMFEEIPLPLNWPVYVKQCEAEDYARWIGKAVPTEQQFHRAAYGAPGEISRLSPSREYPWGNTKPGSRHGNFDFRRWDPEPLDATPLGDSAFGVSQLVGNGWQWTSTVFGPLPNFRPFANYPGYSSNFFDGEHYVMKGGSARTAARLLRRSFRNWFRKDYPYMYAGFRCVEN